MQEALPEDEETLELLLPQAAGQWRWRLVAGPLLALGLCGVAVVALPGAAGRLGTPLAAAPTGIVGLASAGAFNAFCGVAVNTEAGNNYGEAQLKSAVQAAGAGRVWHYNWKPSTNVRADGALFLPMVKHPGGGDALPLAGRDGVGTTVLGWNEPDIAEQAGSNQSLLLSPTTSAKAWVQDMQAARAKGYTEFASPAIAHDTCWMDFFLKGCQATAGCKELVTFLTAHRYRNDCGTYNATPDYQGFREDLGYVLSLDRLVRKYNQRGFRIRGIVMSEFGCTNADFLQQAGEAEQRRYLEAFYRDTVAGVLRGEAAVVERISNSPMSMYIGANGPDADAGGAYSPGKCRWQQEPKGSKPGAEAVKAIRGLYSMAWFSVTPGRNYLFEAVSGGRLDGLGRLYFDACGKVLPARSPELPSTTTQAPTQPPLQPGCHTSVFPEDCYEHVRWAKEHGIYERPDWYPRNLGPNSTLQDFQDFLNKKGQFGCPKPCDSAIQFK